MSSSQTTIRAQNQPDHQAQKSLIAKSVLYVVAAIVFFTVGAGGSLAVQNWRSLVALYHEANLIRYEIMSGQRGPVTYLVTHSDLQSLSDIAEKTDDILGVEQHKYSNVAKMAFSSADSPAIEQVRQHPDVQSMVRRNAPMICH